MEYKGWCQKLRMTLTSRAKLARVLSDARHVLRDLQRGDLAAGESVIRCGYISERAE
jgi:hypothetical protein